MRSLLTIITLFFSVMMGAQDLEGAWLLTHIDGEEVTGKETVKIYQQGYFAYGSKHPGTNEFLGAGGGEYSTSNGYLEKYDFHTEDQNLVGQEQSFEVHLGPDELVLKQIDNDRTTTWKRLPDKKTPLSGNWVITGRTQQGEIVRHDPGARRTIKILGGGRFQWVAFNSETGEFFGTGGGTYSAREGEYIENIGFFSRDNSRVGAILPFKYRLSNGEWHHSGKSSKGEPIYEIWSPYHKAYVGK